MVTIFFQEKRSYESLMEWQCRIRTPNHSNLQCICILSLFDPPLTLLDSSPTSFKSWKTCILYQKTLPKNGNKYHPHPKKSPKHLFVDPQSCCWSHDSSNWLQLIFHFHNASFFPKISSSRKANSPPFFPEKTGQKSSVTSTVLLPPSWSSFFFVWKNFHDGKIQDFF